MENTWWDNLKQLDETQKAFFNLPPEGKYVLTGPPGSGKTNLLVLRGKYLDASGLKNIQFLTYTKSLADFIRSGIGVRRHFDPTLVRTFHSWAHEHLRTYYPDGVRLLEAYIKDRENKESIKEAYFDALRQANDRVPTNNLYDAVLVDEAQDIYREELAIISRLTDRMTISGDARQGLWKRDGLESEGFVPQTLQFHYRIGKSICKIADRIMQPKDGGPTLLENCNYPENERQSDAALLEYESFEAQYSSMTDRISDQLRAYPGESIGIIVPRRELLPDLRLFLDEKGFGGLVADHDLDGPENRFTSGKNIHLITIHSAKGSEFRAVHILNCESLVFTLHRREIIYTAVTRAKTSLTLYFTGNVMAPIRSAFAEPATPDREELFR